MSTFAESPLKAPGAADAYRFDRFSPVLMLADMRFGDDSLAVGERLPDVSLLTAEGEQTTLYEVADGRPIALITGSLSCPMTASAFPSLVELEQRYGDRVRFVLVNVREAHPGNAIEQPQSIEDKLEHARLLQSTSGVTWPVLVDDLDGSLHRLVDAKPNSLHLFDAGGTLIFRALFATDDAAERAIAAAAAGETPTKTSGTQLMGPMLKSAGYIDEVLRSAGRRAYLDVALSAPPIVMLGLLSNALPWLPRERRGVGVAVALGAITTMAVVAFTLLN